ncbi:MAG: hypothetical protein ACKOJI_10920, partial [Phycisphaerales bacterium]
MAGPSRQEKVDELMDAAEKALRGSKWFDAERHAQAAAQGPEGHGHEPVEPDPRRPQPREVGLSVRHLVRPQPEAVLE